MGASQYKVEGDSYNITHKFNNSTASIEYNTLKQVGNNNAWALGHVFTAMYARKISETISGINYEASPISVLNTFNDFVSPRIFDAKAPNFAQLSRSNLSEGYSKVFRHMTWQAIFTKVESAKYAEELGNAQEYTNMTGSNSERREHSFRDLINNYYGRQIGTDFKGDLSTKEGLVDLLNTVSERVISSFTELSNAIPVGQRRIFTVDSPGVDKLFNAINPPKSPGPMDK